MQDLKSFLLYPKLSTSQSVNFKTRFVFSEHDLRERNVNNDFCPGRTIVWKGQHQRPPRIGLNGRWRAKRRLKLRSVSSIQRWRTEIDASGCLRHALPRALQYRDVALGGQWTIHSPTAQDAGGRAVGVSNRLAIGEASRRG